MNTILDYFSHLSGEEVFTFYDESGQPDIIKAREFAEEMRKRFGGLLHTLIEIEQRVHRVFITEVESESFIDRLGRHFRSINGA